MKLIVQRKPRHSGGVQKRLLPVSIEENRGQQQNKQCVCVGTGVSSSENELTRSEKGKEENKTLAEQVKMKK